jgi:EAL domain-containing protein (putative c-di-GMP-specific phosphodiesterase class I)
MSNPEHAVHVLDKLTNLGIELSLDDFGTGYSSLSYLARFPFDTVKIDKSFLGMDPSTRLALMRSMIEMSHALDLSVIAEGVESEASLDELRSLDCDLIQGYVAGPAVPADQAAALIRQQMPMFRVDTAAE